MNTDSINWGISSTGGIATSFAQALALVDDARLLAVSSRTQEKADEFAAAHGAERAYGSLADMAADPDVDVVYIASPHTAHCADALVAVRSGTPVLVEKPFGISAAQAREVFTTAEDAGVFVMEALWSRFLPAHVELRRLVDDGAIGEVRAVEASFGFPSPFGPDHRLLNPALGGGALLDLGVYSVNTALQILGPPDHVSTMATIGPTGVDVNTAVTMHFPDGAVAMALSSLSSVLGCTARVSGTTGFIDVPSMQHRPDALHLTTWTSLTAPPTKRTLELPAGDGALRHQVHEVHRCLRAGESQSPVMSWQHTIDLLTVLDTARAEIGLTYPGESATDSADSGGR